MQLTRTHRVVQSAVTVRHISELPIQYHILQNTARFKQLHFVNTILPRPNLIYGQSILEYPVDLFFHSIAINIDIPQEML